MMAKRYSRTTNIRVDAAVNHCLLNRPLMLETLYRLWLEGAPEARQDAARAHARGCVVRHELVVEDQ